MPKNENALAELAERMKNGYVSLVVNDRQVATFSTAAFPELDKVQRIVAELAKVKVTHYDTACIADCINAYFSCRAIAEEVKRKEN